MTLKLSRTLLALGTLVVAACSPDHPGPRILPGTVWPERGLLVLGDTERGAVRVMALAEPLREIAVLRHPERLRTLSVALDAESSRLWVLDGGSLTGYETHGWREVSRWRAPRDAVLAGMRLFRGADGTARLRVQGNDGRQYVALPDDPVLAQVQPARSRREG